MCGKFEIKNPQLSIYLKSQIFKKFGKNQNEIIPKIRENCPKVKKCGENSLYLKSTIFKKFGKNQIEIREKSKKSAGNLNLKNSQISKSAGKFKIGINYDIIFQIPHLIVINTTSYQHHLPDDEPIRMTPEAVTLFLDSILEGEASVYGGSSYTVRLYR